MAGPLDSILGPSVFYGYVNKLSDKQLRDPVAVLKGITAIQTAVKSEKTKLETLQKNYDTEKKAWLAANKEVTTLYEYTVKNPSAGDIVAKRAALATANNKAIAAKNRMNLISGNISNFNTALQANQKNLKDLTDYKSISVATVAANKTPDSGGAGSGPATPRTSWLYNAPMIQHAYFNADSITPSLQTSLTTLQGTTPEKFTDALSGAFTKKGTRGVIQMSADTASNYKKQMKDKKVAFNPYGFRFHYNPGSISMNYGNLKGMSPELLMSGRDQFNPLTPLDSGSGLQFDLYLNRIEDMNYATASGNLQSANGKTFFSTDLYSENVLAEDIREIYNKGTMYDLEYLFKAVNGPGGDYKSILRGQTSDVGWLNGVAVEFHLGKNLRYLCRINSISVNHAIFNERMVPTLTTVNISASRYYDFRITK
jgi:hypothetical protein